MGGGGGGGQQEELRSVLENSSRLWRSRDPAAPQYPLDEARRSGFPSSRQMKNSTVFAGICCSDLMSQLAFLFSPLFIHKQAIKKIICLNSNELQSENGNLIFLFRDFHSVVHFQNGGVG